MRFAELACCLMLLSSCALTRVQGDEPGDRDPTLERGLSRSSAGLSIDRATDGRLRVDLQGRFRSATLVFRDSEGRLQRQCIDHPSGLAAPRGDRR